MLPEMAIFNRIKILIAEKELREHRKLPYRTIADETGISLSTINDYLNQNIGRYDKRVLEAFCRYFNCQPGDLLVYSADDPTHS